MYGVNQSLPTITYTSSIGHLVWHDINADGVWAGESTEPGIQGVEVTLILNGIGKQILFFSDILQQTEQRLLIAQVLIFFQTFQEDLDIKFSLHLLLDTLLVLLAKI
jgi:hypothetical protein